MTFHVQLHNYCVRIQISLILYNFNIVTTLAATFIWLTLHCSFNSFSQINGTNVICLFDCLLVFLIDVLILVSAFTKNDIQHIKQGVELLLVRAILPCA